MKAIRMALLAACVLLMSGCSAARQIEGQAFAVTMAIDLEDNGRIELSVQLPALSGESDRQTGDYVISSAAGFSFEEALNLLNATVPRTLNLTQLKSVIVSERLAESDAFADLLGSVKEHYLIYGEAALIVCSGEAKAMLEEQKTLIGVRLSDSVVTAMERYADLGSIPRTTLTRVVHMTESFYGDPMAVLAGVSGGGNAPASDESEPGAAYAGALRREGDNKDEYYGAALLKDGRMVGRLTGAQTKTFNLMCGMGEPLAMIIESVPMTVRREEKNVTVDLSGSAPVIDVRLDVLVTMAGRRVDSAVIARALEDRLDELTALCQEAGVDPFGYAAKAAGQFLTARDWIDYDWHSRFPNALVRCAVRVRQEE